VGEPGPSLAIQCILPQGATPWFERSLDAAIDAASLAVADGFLGRWRASIGVVGDGAAPDATLLARCAERAAAGGGAVGLLSVPAHVGEADSHRRLLEGADEDLVLLVGADVLLLGTTLTRLLSLVPDEGSAIGARFLPLDRPGGVGIRTHDEGRCLLARRAVLPRILDATFDAAVGRPGASARRARRGRQSPLVAPAAIALRVGGDLAPSRDNPGSHLAASGSLLERALALADLDEASALLTRALDQTSSPLLSVVMRTQVRRPEALREALLCLAGQSDGRFELLLVVHDADPDEARRVLEDLPGWLASRTRILVAPGGTRSHPLNVGIAAAVGSQVAFLDDDDWVFGDWVERFLEAASENPRQLLRARVGVLHVAELTWPGGIEGYKAEATPSSPYPERFDLADHLRVNQTPFMAWAFPRRFFEVFGGADEDLEVCEDWDLVLRAARVLGVVDIPALTAIYRRWDSGGDSYSTHDQATWARDMSRVRSRIDSGPLLLPAGSAERLARFSAEHGTPAELASIYGSISWRITTPLRGAARLARTLAGRLRNAPGAR
jgi:hypothetical protein